MEPTPVTQAVTTPAETPAQTAEVALPNAPSIMGESPAQQAEQPSPDAPQTGAEAPPSTEGKQPDEKAATEDFEARYKSDAEFKKYVDTRANALKQKDQAKQDRQARKTEIAQAVSESGDSKAKTILQTELEDIEADEDAEAGNPRQKSETYHGKVAPFLSAIATDPETKDHYAAVYEREGKAKLSTLLSADPVGGALWINAEVLKLKSEADTEKSARVRSEALALEKTNKALAGLPTPAVGTGAPVATFVNQRELMKAWNAGNVSDAVYYSQKDKLSW